MLPGGAAPRIRPGASSPRASAGRARGSPPRHARHDHGPPVQGRPGGPQRVADVGQSAAPAGLRRGPAAGRPGSASACLGPRRDDPGQRAAPGSCGTTPGCPAASRPACGRLLQDHVRVGAADPERGHPGAPGPPRLRPRHRLGQQRTPSPAAQSTCGVGSSLCNDLGSTPWRIAMTILITPATPAAAWAVTDIRLDRPQPAAAAPSGRSRP